MRKFRMVRAITFGLFAVVAVAVLSLTVMGLWNWLMPTIFRWQVITFWQALGLLILSRILFGRFGGSGGRTHWRRRMRERWSQMTPDEREKFTQGMRDGPHSPRATDPVT